MACCWRRVAPAAIVCCFDVLLSKEWMMSYKVKRVPCFAGAWLVDFYAGEKLLETRMLFRSQVPTRWARKHLLTLQRHCPGQLVIFCITAM
jgi:hypothetical protein